MQGSEAEGCTFEKLDVYQRALEFLVVGARIISELPGGNASLTDQLRRAALSVPVTLAEGEAQRWNVPRFSMLAGLCS